MCGIAGLIVFKSSSLDPDSALKNMVESLEHRGPDDFGTFKRDNVYLGHTRLSIIDVEGGHQPIHSKSDDIIIGNGEIYNYIELKQSLKPQNYNSDSDFEPALQACIEKGVKEGTQSWRGMYASSVWLKNSDSLICIRDPFGIKPLYYVQTPDYFAFASEPRALIRAGLAKNTLNTQHVVSTLNLNYTPFEKTVYQDIKRLLPGETQTINIQTGNVASEVNDIARPLVTKTAMEDPLKQFDQIFEDSILVHQRSDVPYGLFLSGGIDSCSILAMMARLNDKPVKTFTCGFDSNTVHDERSIARRVSDHYKTDHIETTFTHEDFINLLPKVAAALDDPTFDPAVLPTYKLAQLAKDHVKVVLSGEGGDEVFAGYGRYRKFKRPFLLGGGRFSSKPLLSDLNLKTSWINPLLGLQSEILKDKSLDKLQQAQLHDIKTWLPADLLLKLDRCLMAHSLEGRTPFLDKHVFEFGFNLPQKYKIKHRQGKWLLRQWLKLVCPAADPFARKKGFTVPVNAWIEQHFRELLPLLKKNEGLLELMDVQKIEQALSDQKASWPILFYAVWYQININKASEKLNLFEVLA